MKRGEKTKQQKPYPQQLSSPWVLAGWHPHTTGWHQTVLKAFEELHHLQKSTRYLGTYEKKKGKAPLKQPGPISVSSCKGVNNFLEKHILISQKPCLQWPVTVANCSTVTKHINANALLYPSLQPDYQKSRSYFPALDNFHRRLSGPIQPNPSIQNYLWWNSSYFKTTFDKTADISAGFTSKIVI